MTKRRNSVPTWTLRHHYSYIPYTAELVAASSDYVAVHYFCCVPQFYEAVAVYRPTSRHQDGNWRHQVGSKRPSWQKQEQLASKKQASKEQAKWLPNNQWDLRTMTRISEPTLTLLVHFRFNHFVRTVSGYDWTRHVKLTTNQQYATEALQEVTKQQHSNFMQLHTVHGSYHHSDTKSKHISI